ncbi:MAG: hypothetical protein JRI76_03760 [Deltaproteobacteria bacterium]|nr:hypothetical protein [Deltaproteobacteria bacterium]MBW2041130.1 hypothetical protein [Deltaproteobacteria bacterium]MBW2131914.1 hypothetical protein [Deltaproteobacteria bacterium]
MTGRNADGRNENWFDRGYRKGFEFAWYEADYDELAAVSRAGTIPVNWDLFRAEILNRHLASHCFDFQAYSAGFAKACMDIFEQI